MKFEKKRIFISDLPEATNQSEIETLFKAYGNLISVEIKNRKELGPKNRSLSFAYVNIETDDRALQRCFRDFVENDWHGEYVQLQLAKESFLDRLKREREESGQNNVFSSTDLPSSNAINGGSSPQKLAESSTKLETPQKSAVTTWNNSGSVVPTEEAGTTKKKKRRKESLCNDADTTGTLTNGTHLPSETSDYKDVLNQSDSIDIVIKNNKYRVGDKRKLKIEKTGNEPIAVIDLKKPKFKKVVTESVPEIKRSQSVKEKVKAYTERKTLIKQALSNVDSTSRNKIIFNEDGEFDSSFNAQSSKESLPILTKSLFDPSDEEDDFQPDFQFKEQYEGAKGKKLLSMQARFNNDERFALDKRFLEDDGNEGKPMQYSQHEYNGEVKAKQNDNDDSIDEEKKKEFEILSEILGKKIVSNPSDYRKDSFLKRMIRYDPNDENCSKLELKKEEPLAKKKKEKDPETLMEKKQEDKEQPIVSKDVFYKVNQDLKDTMHQSTQGFSLLRTFGQTEIEKDKEEQNGFDAAQELPKTQSKLFPDRNPFKYDSSDDDDETKNLPSQETIQELDVSREIKRNNINNRLRSDPFFFKEDDYRFQDGLDFIKRIALKDNGDFLKVRQELKSIVRSKVRNNQRKNKPFKKKLGGNAKKKRLRMNKALQR